MAQLVFRLNSPGGVIPMSTLPISPSNQLIANQWLQFWDPASPAKSMARWAREMDAARVGATFWTSAELQVIGSGALGGGSGLASPATGTITITSGSGAVGATIAGTLQTVTWATSDAATAAVLAAAINANATISQYVYATVNVSSLTTPAKITLTATTLPWDNLFGNFIALVASGTGVTVSGALLTGGVASDSSQVVNL